LKPSSAKQKGRVAQQEIRDSLLDSIYIPAGLEADDVTSRPMGCNGVDIILTPAARRVLDLEIEVKNREALVVPTTFWEHYKKYKASAALKLLAHRKNRQDMLVTLRWIDFMELIKPKRNLNIK
jgi:hypothetical protein